MYYLYINSTYLYLLTIVNIPMFQKLLLNMNLNFKHFFATVFKILINFDFRINIPITMDLMTNALIMEC